MITKLAESTVPTKEMLDFFYSRTRKHINNVVKYLRIIYNLDQERFKLLPMRELLHDISKYYEPEFTPYVFLTWKYHCKDIKKEFNISDEMQKSIDEASLHHIKNNRHHPEFFDESVNSSSNKDKLVDATGMGELDLAEMVADWCGMSAELGGDPVDQAKKEIGIKFKLNNKQTKFVYTLLSSIKSRNDN